MLATQIPLIIHWAILLALFSLFAGACAGIGFLLLSARRQR
jgi:hypothetical protein